MSMMMKEDYTQIVGRVDGQTAKAVMAVRWLQNRGIWATMKW